MQFTFFKILILSLITASYVQAEAENINWFNHLSSEKNIEGASVDEVYKQYEVQNSEDIIVAVIDSGVDINHEDLQGQIWVNQDEIIGNGIDDDNNGYVDDIFGWNFLGNKKGMAQIISATDNSSKLKKGKKEYQVHHSTYAITRELKKLIDLQTKLESMGLALLPKELRQLNRYKDQVDAELSASQEGIQHYEVYKRAYLEEFKILKPLGLKEVTFTNLQNIIASSDKEKNAKKRLLRFINMGITLERLNIGIEEFYSDIKYHYNINYSMSRDIIHDDENNMNDTNYGNNDVIGPDASHGTHAAGIIAANRDNGIGINGVATNVKIMALRVVPTGDERDKDVANAIIYAVDNGARIINISFGKYIKENKEAVDRAVRYAWEKDVLIIHAAGNDNINLDEKENYPSKKLEDGNVVDNWITVGASSLHANRRFAAGFSNYGQETVDIFAPGVDIYSTVSDNKYEISSGTSAAAPIVAGVCALALSFNPNLSSTVLKDTILSTARTYPGLQVVKPGLFDVHFSQLSKTGGTVDALQAIKSIE